MNKLRKISFFVVSVFLLSSCQIGKSSEKSEGDSTVKVEFEQFEGDIEGILSLEDESEMEDYILYETREIGPGESGDEDWLDLREEKDFDEGLMKTYIEDNEKSAYSIIAEIYDIEDENSMTGLFSEYKDLHEEKFEESLDNFRESDTQINVGGDSFVYEYYQPEIDMDGLGVTFFKKNVIVTVAYSSNRISNSERNDLEDVAKEIERRIEKNVEYNSKKSEDDERKNGDIPPKISGDKPTKELVEYVTGYEIEDRYSSGNKFKTKYLNSEARNDSEYLPDDYYKGLVTVVGAEGYGSGFVFGEDGDDKFIMTNAHVIDQGSDFFYVLSYEGELLKADYPKNIDYGRDLAVLIVESEHLEPLEYNESQIEFKGDLLISVGSPSGEVNSIGSGYITNSYEHVYVNSIGGRAFYARLANATSIQTAGGNSGGPVFNQKGELVGVLYAGIDGIPYSAVVDNMDLVDRILDFLDDRDFEKIDFGFDCDEVQSRDALEFYNYLQNDLYPDKEIGLCEITKVDRNSYASKAGLEEGDLIRSIGTNDIPADKRAFETLIEGAEDMEYQGRYGDVYVSISYFKKDPSSSLRGYKNEITWLSD